MLNSLSTFIGNLTEHNNIPFSLSELKDFPCDEFQRNRSRYTELERWYTGEALEEVVIQDGKEISRYPVQVNPIPSQVQKHTHFLFGQVDLDERSLVYPRLKPFSIKDEEITDEQRKLAELGNRVLHTVWNDE